MIEPAKYEEKLVLENDATKQFKKVRDFKALRRFLEKKEQKIEKEQERQK